MRKSLIHTGMLGAVLSIAFFGALVMLPHAASAQVDPAAPAQTPAGTPAPAGDTAPTAQAPEAEKPAVQAGAADGKCGVLDIGKCVLNAIATVTVGLANFMLGIAGVLLNWVIVKTVFEFSQVIGNTQGVLAAWGILRDIGNILILFGFIFMGMAVILELQNYPMKKALPGLLLFAVFLNFSLFAAEAIIDTSNALTTVLYTQANTDPCQDLFNQDCALNHGIAGHIMQTTGLSGIYDFPSTDAVKFTDQLWIILVMAIFATIGTLVLLAAAIMLIIRAVTLTLLIITSPIGFAGSAIPPLAGFAKDWWHKLIHQAFFAPILLLLIFVSLKVTDSLGGITGNNSLGEALTSSTPASVMGIILVFALAIGFLIASLIAANKFGAMGAGFAIKTASSATFGGGSFIGRRLVGGSAYQGAQALRKTAFARTGLGRLTLGGLDKAASSSYDVRSMVKSKSLNLGGPSKTARGGYKEIVAQAKKKTLEHAKKLQLTAEEEQKLKGLQETLKKIPDTKANKAAREKLQNDIKAIENAPQAEYAMRIARMKSLDDKPRRAFSPVSVERSSKKEAAAEILKSMKKTDTQKLIDVLTPPAAPPASTPPPAATP